MRPSGASLSAKRPASLRDFARSSSDDSAGENRTGVPWGIRARANASAASVFPA